MLAMTKDGYTYWSMRSVFIVVYIMETSLSDIGIMY